MFEIIRSEYGRKINTFEFDYLGQHKSLDGVILNADVKLYEKGLLITTQLSEKYVYLKWDEITEINYIKGKGEKLQINYAKGTIVLEKAKKELDVNEFLTLVSEAAPDIYIIKTECKHDEEYRCDIPEERLKEFDEQDKRIAKILEGIDEDDDIKMLEIWAKYLKDKLKFPFEAEIIEPQEGGFLRAGDRVNVNCIEDFDDLYGVIASVSYKKIKYSFPLCDLETVDKDSDNFSAVDDYSMWFANR